MEKESDPIGSTRTLLAFHVPDDRFPPFHITLGKPGIHIHTPRAETHGIKPGSGDDLPQARSTNGRRQTTSRDSLLQLSRQGPHGAELPQPTCPASAGPASGRGPGSGS